MESYNGKKWISFKNIKRVYKEKSMQNLYTGEESYKLVLAEVVKERPNFLEDCKKYNQLYCEEEIDDADYYRLTKQIFVEKYTQLYDRGNKLLQKDIQNYLNYCKAVERKYVNKIAATTFDEELLMWRYDDEKKRMAVQVLNLITGKLKTESHGGPTRASFINKRKVIRRRAREVFLNRYFEKQGWGYFSGNAFIKMYAELGHIAIKFSDRKIARGILIFEPRLSIVCNDDNCTATFCIVFVNYKKVGFTMLAEEKISGEKEKTVKKYHEVLDELDKLKSDKRALFRYMQKFYDSNKLQKKTLLLQ